MPNNQTDYDLCVCEVTRATYMAMLNEFRTINPDLRDRVDDPPKEDGNITYLALVGKAKGEKWHPLFGGNPFDDQRLGAGWVNTTTGYGGGLFKTRLDVPVPVAKVLQESRKALAYSVNLTKLFATLDVSQVFQTDNRNLKRYNAIYLNAWTYSPEYIEALREVLNKACRKAHGFSTHTIYIDGTLIGETEGYDDSELTRSYLCEQIQELVSLSIKYSGLV